MAICECRKPRNVLTNPEGFAPHNNGWCAWAESHGYTAELDFVGSPTRRDIERKT